MPEQALETGRSRRATSNRSAPSVYLWVCDLCINPVPALIGAVLLLLVFVSESTLAIPPSTQIVNVASATYQVGGAGFSVTASETVTTDALAGNSPPYDLLLSDTTVTAGIGGAVVGDLSVLDPDPADTHAFTLDDGRFEVVNGELKLKLGISLSLGTSVNITVTATDPGGLSYSEVFSVTATPPGSGSGANSNLQFLALDPTGGLSSQVGTSQCSTSADATGPFQDILSLLEFSGTGIPLPGSVMLTGNTIFKLGQALFLQVIDPDANQDPVALEQVQVVLISDTGDSELIRIRETETDSGISIGYIQSVSASPIAGNCQLEGSIDGSFEANYVDPTDPTDLARAQILVDPHGVVFESASGQLISGTRITLIDAATGNPAQVSGDTPGVGFPAQVVTGATLQDDAGASYDFPNGGYRFPFVTPGDYQLLVEPPNRFTFPSVVDDASLQSLPSAPYRLIPGSRGAVFNVPVGPVFRVDIPLDLVPLTETTSRLELLRFDPADPARQIVPVGSTSCLAGGSLVTRSDPVSSAGSIALPGNVALIGSSSFRRGEPVFLRLVDGDQDRDPFAPDTIDVTLSNSSGSEAETLRLSETGASTGVFTGFIQTRSGAIVANDCFLSGRAGNDFVVQYQDPGQADDQATATGILDPGFLLFSSADGRVLDGAVVTLIDESTGQPAVVMSDDGVSSFPATVTSGGSVFDGAGNQVNFAPGRFRFPILAPGNYRLNIQPPVSYLYPSSSEISRLNQLPGSPFEIADGSRGEVFSVSVGQAAGFDIPLDPVSAEVFVAKKASKEVVAPGDFLQYQVLVQNLSEVGGVSDAHLFDRLPKGFRYVSGSARINGQTPIEPEIDATGRELNFRLDQIPVLDAGSSFDVRYVTEVTAAAELGRAVNRARFDGIGVSSSNVATASVTVQEDLLQSTATLAGRLLESDCDMASPDRKEMSPGSSRPMPGIANARVYLEDGSYVITDEQGRYHFEGLKPGRHVVQLDEISLPRGYEVVLCQSNSRSGGSAFSRFVDLQAGSLWREDFYIKASDPVREDVTAQLVSQLRPGVIDYTFDLKTPSTPLTNLRVVILLADGLVYVENSARYDDRPLEDPADPASGALTFNLGDSNQPGGHHLSIRTRFQPPVPNIETKALLMFESKDPEQPEKSKRYRSRVLKNVISAADDRAESIALVTRTPFDEAQAGLNDAALADLSRVDSVTRSGDPVFVDIVGHADNRDLSPQARLKFQDNYALSAARARTVADYMSDRLKIPQSHIYTVGRGADQPVADNQTAAGRAQNRRVELTVVQQQNPVQKTTESEIGVVSVTRVVSQADANAFEIPEMQSSSTPIFDAEWLSRQDAGTRLIWPEENYNPRIPSVGAVVKHAAGERVELRVNGKLADPLNFEGKQTDRKRGIAASHWRNLSLQDGNNLIEARVLDATDRIRTTLRREIHYSGTPVRAELVREQSQLIGDGVSRPVIGVRLFDREGFPVRPGLTGDFSIREPYRVFDDSRLLEKLNGVQEAPKENSQKYVVRKDGIAYIQLEPTTRAGEVKLRFDFDDHRYDEIRTRIAPAPREWILVGFGEGSLGYQTLSGNMQNLSDANQEEGFDGDTRLAFYAKGQIKGEYLLSLAYDSDKKGGRKLGQQIDPNQFYTLYGDATEQRYDAESQRKLYLRLEGRDFDLLFGDFETRFDEAELTRYTRAMNGLQLAQRGAHLTLQAFASETDQALVRDEIPGDGTSGEYSLSRNGLVSNSENIVIEVRDRFKSEVILSQQTLSRYTDYSIDYARGTLIFKHPVFSQDENFNPIYIVANYEVEGSSQGEELVAGSRISYRLDESDSQAAVSYIHDGSQQSDLIGADLKWHMSDTTLVRAEWAGSESDSQDRGSAYLMQIEHQSSELAGRLYVREQQAAFGLGQQNATEAGTRKMGVEGEYRPREHLLVRGEVFQQSNLSEGNDRFVAQTEVHYRRNDSTLKAGLRSVREELLSGETQESNQLKLGASRNLLDQRLTLRGDAELDVSTNGESSDYPTRVIAGAEYEVMQGLRAIAEQELSFSDLRNTQDTRIGLNSKPWTGADINANVERQMSENGERLFATTGLLQQWRLNDHWLMDAGLDRVQTLKQDARASDAEALSFDPALPPASGSVNNDFTAAFLGVGYRDEAWDATSRLEYHHGDVADKWNLLAGVSRQLSEGIVTSSSFSLLFEESADGNVHNRIDWRMGLAFRPLDSKWMFLNRLDLSFDEHNNGAFDTRGRKLVNNFNANFRANSRSQLSLQFAFKYLLEQIDGDDYEGFTGLYGFEYRHDVSTRWDVGLQGKLKHSPESAVYEYASGVSVGYNPLHNLWLSIGYNLTGFEDRDFFAAGYTAKGPYVSFRFKLDQQLAKRFLEYARGASRPQESFASVN